MVEEAWRNALTSVPKPDPARLDDQAIELSLDVELTLEVGAVAVDRSHAHGTQQLLQGELFGMGNSWNSGN